MYRMSKESGDFAHILARLEGKRAVMDGDKVLLHYGDVGDVDDPRWFVVDKNIAGSLSSEIASALGLTKLTTDDD